MVRVRVRVRARGRGRVRTGLRVGVGGMVRVGLKGSVGVQRGQNFPSGAFGVHGLLRLAPLATKGAGGPLAASRSTKRSTHARPGMHMLGSSTEFHCSHHELWCMHGGWGGGELASEDPRSPPPPPPLSGKLSCRCTPQRAQVSAGVGKPLHGPRGCIWMHLVNGMGNSPSPERPTPGVVKQDKSSGGSVDTTKTRSGPQRVRMSSGERPMGAAKGTQIDTEPPPPPRVDLVLISQHEGLCSGCMPFSEACVLRSFSVIWSAFGLVPSAHGCSLGCTDVPFRGQGCVIPTTRPWVGGDSVERGRSLSSCGHRSPSPGQARVPLARGACSSRRRWGGGGGLERSGCSVRIRLGPRLPHGCHGLLSIRRRSALPQCELCPEVSPRSCSRNPCWLFGLYRVMRASWSVVTPAVTDCWPHSATVGGDGGAVGCPTDARHRR